MADDDLNDAEDDLDGSGGSLRDLDKLIDAKLAELRPDRILSGPAVEPGDKDLMTLAQHFDAVTAAITGDPLVAYALPDNPTVILVRERVAKRETQASNRINHVLRKSAEQGQPPLFVHDLDSFPVAIESRVQRPGKDPVIKKERVALRAMRPVDWDSFSNGGRERKAKRDHAEWMTFDGGDVFKALQVKQRAKFFKTVTVEELPEDNGSPA